MKAKYDLLIKELTKRNVACKVKLGKFNGVMEIDIEVGMDCPDEICLEASEAIDTVGLDHKNTSVCAEVCGLEVLESERVCGGPKRYFNGKVW